MVSVKCYPSNKSSFRTIEDAIARRWSSPLSTNWEKWQNRISFIIGGNDLQWLKSDSYTMLWTSHHYKTFTQCRNEGSVAEIDTSSIFKILWLDHLLALASSIFVRLISSIGDNYVTSAMIGSINDIIFILTNQQQL